MSAEWIPLTKEQEDACLEDIDYSRAQLAQDVKTIREWLNVQVHLPESRKKEDDFFIIQFLMGCKGSLEKTKRKLDGYFSLKSLNLLIASNLDPLNENLIQGQNFYQLVLLPRALPDGTRIRFSRFKPEFFVGEFRNPMKSGHILYEFNLRRKNEIPSNRMMTIFDAKGITPDILSCLSPSLFKELSYIFKEALPLRLQKIIIFNSAKFLDLTINYVAKPFLRKKMMDRLVITSQGSEFLHKHIPKEVLPADYGGESPTLDEIHGRLIENIRSVRHLLINEWSEKSEESKRPPGQRRIANEDFGLHGSIKKLCID